MSAHCFNFHDFHNFHKARRVLFVGMTVAGAFTGAVMGQGNAVSESSEPQAALIDQEPFDRITLDAANKNTVIRVLPIDFPNRVVPADRAGGDSVRVRLIERPERQYDIQWQHIKKIELYEQMVLEESRRLTKDGQFNEAFRGYAYLMRNFPETRDLEKEIEGFLLADALNSFREQQWDRAFTLLLELGDRNPKSAAAANGLDKTAEKLVAQWARDRNFVAARNVIRLLKKKFPDQPRPALDEWESKFRAYSKKLLSDATKAFRAGRFREAKLLTRSASDVWPDTPGVAELLQRVHAAYPQVFVGVMNRPGEVRTDRLDDWAARRQRRLVARKLMELTGYGADGGNYELSSGKYELDPTATLITLEIDPAIRWSSGDAVTGADLARCLLEMTRPENPFYREEWARLLVDVSVDSVFRVQARLSRPHLRPAALLQTSLVRNYVDLQGGLQQETLGPYQAMPAIEGDNPRETRFELDQRYAAPQGLQPREIVERFYDDSDEAVAALRAGDIDVLDDVAPWDVASLEEDRNIEVRPYGFPLVDVLIPSAEGLAASRTFRRALVYGIQRELILNTEFLGNQQRPGHAVLSGPFPVSATIDDAIGYATNPAIEPRLYNPRLAQTLATVALYQWAKQEGKPTDQGVEMPELVLAHAPDSFSRVASQAIADHLKRIGVKLRLQPWEPGSDANSSKKYDLLFARLAMWEPIVDARRLLDGHLMQNPVSPYMIQALAELSQARNSKETRDKLFQIHQIAHDNLPVIPLWQTIPHFAYRPALHGIGERPALIYQQIEAWQIDAQLVAESP
ncbi:MAG: hypothetical protein KDA42_14730 [Planctomycetales bacterium]|nr:hypothetical protein [Planctomycetales bacterium]